ncbi:MAG: CoA-transferase subunit beta [Bacteroidales bacterium]|nr:CoA-transferase subunit beta [Bacteroidales bacterium]
MSKTGYTSNEMMVITASRFLKNDAVVFIGIGLPSLAANLARKLHAPNISMIYESGTLDTKPDRPPLSIGDDELSRKALSIVSVPEMFRYWLQGGRIDIGFLGAAQIDRFANINTTVIGDYNYPKIRLPGAGGATEIAGFCTHTLVMLQQTSSNFVNTLDFISSVGFGKEGNSRPKLGFTGKGPQAVITDLGIMEQSPETKELIMTHLHPGVSVEQASESTGWPLKFAESIKTTTVPLEKELSLLRKLEKMMK